MSSASRNTLYFPQESRTFLEPHLQHKDLSTSDAPLPFTTITFATSLDSQLSLSPGTQTVLSGPQSKAMTHYLRSRHDAILIGVGTAIADNPSLNCRLDGVGGYGGEGLEGQPRPIVIDPSARWDFSENSKIFKLSKERRGRAPFIVTALTNPPAEKKALLESLGGKFIKLNFATTESGEHKMNWKDILQAITAEGLKSVMIEGGGSIINSLLVPEYFALINSVIVTIAPTWLGQGGVVVSPPRRLGDGGKPIAALRLDSPVWHPFGDDVVLCGKIKH